jgi:hypothetical protein
MEDYYGTDKDNKPLFMLCSCMLGKWDSLSIDQLQAILEAMAIIIYRLYTVELIFFFTFKHPSTQVIKIFKNKNIKITKILVI